MRTKQSSGFTIVELLIVIVIIAILAAISVVLYNGIQARAVKTALQSDLRNAATKVALSKAEKGSYPTDEEEALALFTPTPGTHYQYSTPDNGATYLMTITSDREGVPAYCQSSNGSITEGACAGHSEGGGGGTIADGSPIQTVTSANCPSTRTRVVDARDNHTYWVQKLADGKCWMLTNLGYVGGGTNTYGDVKTVSNDTGGSGSYTLPYYYIVPSTVNYTTEPTAPSALTTGMGQYGYFYNWCAAMGGQTSTSACANAATLLPDPTISICASGWRLPTGNGGEFSGLNTAINSGSSTSDSGLLSGWLAQRGGRYSGGTGWGGAGSYGWYWSSAQVAASTASVFNLTSTAVNFGSPSKNMGTAVRCIAI